MSSEIVSANFKVGSTENGTETTIASISGTALNIRSGINIIKIYSDGNSEASLVKFKVGANVATYVASGKTTINGGKIHAGSNIKIGNMDGASDYCEINKGDITFHKYFPTLGHKPTKSLKRLEIGTAKSGEEKELPGYWAETPQVFISPMSIQTYIKDSGAQNQTLLCLPPTPYLKSEGKWAFVPEIALVVSAMSGLGNVRPINYEDFLVNGGGGEVFHGFGHSSGILFSDIETGTAYDITESNVIAMNVKVDLCAAYHNFCAARNGYAGRPYQPARIEVYKCRFYMRVGYFVTNTWLASDWVLFESIDRWSYKTVNILVSEQADEISKIRVEVKPYDENASSCRSNYILSISDSEPGVAKDGVVIKSILINYTGTYGTDSVSIKGDVNYIAVSAG